MKQEEKSLLLKDLCARLPYGVKVKSSRRRESVILSLDVMTDFHLGCSVKPYLRPMSSMTEDERKEYYETMHEYTHRLYPNSCDWSEHTEYSWTIATFDWLNKKMFDYRGLIPKGLALEAPKDMYNIKTE